MLRKRATFRDRLAHFWVHTVLHADDPPDRIALGMAIGVFVTFTPTVGVQMAIVLFLTWLLRANTAVALPIVWVSNPFTMVPIYWSSYHVGRFMLAAERTPPGWWNELRSPPAGAIEQIHFYWERFAQIAGSIWIGGMVVGFLLAYPTYYLTRRAVELHRSRGEETRAV